MTIANYKILDGKKFMWDGQTYSTEEEARKVESEYKKNDFETRVVAEEDYYLVYTRRVVNPISDKDFHSQT